MGVYLQFPSDFDRVRGMAIGRSRRLRIQGFTNHPGCIRYDAALDGPRTD